MYSKFSKDCIESIPIRKERYYSWLNMCELGLEQLVICVYGTDISAAGAEDLLNLTAKG